MKKKYQLTGCAKFFLILLVLAPLAYIGASYYNGEDGIKNLKALIGLDGSKSVESPEDDTAHLEDQLSTLKKQLRNAEQETERLKSELENCQQAKQN